MQLDWFQFFDELKRRGHFASDAQLADSLGLTRSQISAWRKYKIDLGTLTKINILDAFGHDTLRSALLSLLPEKNRQELIKRQEQLIARVNRSGQLFEQGVHGAFAQRVRVRFFQHWDWGIEEVVHFRQVHRCLKMECLYGIRCVFRLIGNPGHHVQKTVSFHPIARSTRFGRAPCRVRRMTNFPR